MPRGGFVLSCVETYREPAVDIDRLIDLLVIDKRTLGSCRCNHGRNSVRVTGCFHGVAAGGVGE